jgi:hypothetical protein
MSPLTHVGLDRAVREDEWFLTAAERGNRATRLDHRHGDGLAWSTGNDVTVLVHGVAYFGELLRSVQLMCAGDLLLFTDWRGDPGSAAGRGWPPGVASVRRRGLSGGSGQGVAVAFSPGPVCVQRAGESPPRRRDRGGRRVRARYARAPRRIPPSEVRRAPASWAPRAPCGWRDRLMP